MFLLIISLFAVYAAAQPHDATIGDPASTGQPAGATDNTVVATAVPQQFAGDLDNFLFLPQLLNVPLHPFAQEVVELTNVQRATAGCPPLQISSRLTAAALGHSEDMAVNDYFSHTSENGDSPWDRIRATGYEYSRAAENIAAGYGSPASVVNAWMNSSGHRANILNCALTEIGVGYYYHSPDTGSKNYYHYWTQVFATPK